MGAPGERAAAHLGERRGNNISHDRRCRTALQRTGSHLITHGLGKIALAILHQCIPLTTQTNLRLTLDKLASISSIK